jgi:pimeloyl-ACP methyl ester carboxylesterase
MKLLTRARSFASSHRAVSVLELGEEIEVLPQVVCATGPEIRDAAHESLYSSAGRPGQPIVQRMLAMSAHISAVEIPGAGHSVHHEQPDEVIAAMRQFLS